MKLKTKEDELIIYETYIRTVEMVTGKKPTEEDAIKFVKSLKKKPKDNGTGI